MLKQHFPFNMIPRTNKQGSLYYQARFFGESGKPLTAKSYPDCQSWTEAYIHAKKDISNGTIPQMSKDALKEKKRILTQGDLSTIARITGKKYDRDVLAVLLGALCGLSVKEVVNLRYEHINFRAPFLRVMDTDKSRVILIPRQVMSRIAAVRDAGLSARYVVPNSSDAEKPCNPITLYRAMENILSLINLDENCHMQFSWLRYTFVDFLLFRGVEPSIIDILCGYKHLCEADDAYKIYETLNAAMRAVERGIISWVQLPWVG